MKKDEFSRMLTEVDEELIQEAWKARQKSNKKSFLRWVIAAAAAVVLLIAGGLVLHWYNDRENVANSETTPFENASADRISLGIYDGSDLVLLKLTDEAQVKAALEELSQIKGKPVDEIPVTTSLLPVYYLVLISGSDQDRRMDMYDLASGYLVHQDGTVYAFPLGIEAWKNKYDFQEVERGYVVPEDIAHFYLSDLLLRTKDGWRTDYLNKAQEGPCPEGISARAEITEADGEEKVRIFVKNDTQETCTFRKYAIEIYENGTWYQVPVPLERTVVITNDYLFIEPGEEKLVREYTTKSVVEFGPPGQYGFCFDCLRVPYEVTKDGKVVLTDSSESSAETDSSESPTGYSSGRLQREFLYYKGTVYVYAASYVKTLPDHYLKVGEILSVDNENMPTSDFQAANLEIGEEVYTFEGSETATDMYIIVKRSEDRFEKFVVYSRSGSQAEAEKQPLSSFRARVNAVTGDGFYTELFTEDQDPRIELYIYSGEKEIRFNGTYYMFKGEEAIAVLSDRKGDMTEEVISDPRQDNGPVITIDLTRFSVTEEGDYTVKIPVVFGEGTGEILLDITVMKDSGQKNVSFPEFLEKSQSISFKVSGTGRGNRYIIGRKDEPDSYESFLGIFDGLALTETTAAASFTHGMSDVKATFWDKDDLFLGEIYFYEQFSVMEFQGKYYRLPEVNSKQLRTFFKDIGRYRKNNTDTENETGQLTTPQEVIERYFAESYDYFVRLEYPDLSDVLDMDSIQCRNKVEIFREAYVRAAVF